MKKLLTSLISTAGALVALFSLAVPLLAPVAVNAQTAQDSTSSTAYCFNNNMGESRPISSSDANALATILTEQGFWTSGTPITTYDDAVASAVSGFQEKYASAILTPNGLSYGTGYVGASTRTELNVLANCGSSSTPSQPVQCPAGYTCTPINQNPAPVCPAGWTCTPMTNPGNTGNPIQPINPVSPANPIQPTDQTSSSLPPGYIETLNNSQNSPTAPGLIWVAWETLGQGYTYTVSASPSYPGSVETGTAISQVNGINGMNMGCWGDNTVCYNGGGPFPTNGPYTFTVTATGPNGQTVNIGTSNPAYVMPLGGGVTPTAPSTTSPTITSITPTSGTAGTQITIYGSAFDNNPDGAVNFSQNGQVYLQMGYGTNVQASNNQVTFTLPAGQSANQPNLPPGIYQVSVVDLGANGMVSSNSVNFTVTSNSPTAGPTFSLSGTPTISKVTTATGYKYTATFNVNVTAVGESVNLALPNSTNMYPAFGNSVDASNVVETYVNGIPVITRLIVASYSQPTNTTLSQDGTYFTVAQNQSVTIPVTYTFNVTNPGANAYALQLNGIYSFVGSAPATMTSFTGQTAWRTPSI